MGIISLDLGLYGATFVLFHIISVVQLWLAGGGRRIPEYADEASEYSAEPEH